MKRILNLMFIAVVMLSAAGCLNEKYDRCPLDPLQDNVALNFRLDDGNGGCRLLAHISLVDIAVYDNAGRFVISKSVSQAELERFKGVTFTLPPGQYGVVAWGNIGENCLHNDMDIVHAAHVAYKENIGGKVNNADKAFYAPLNGSEIHGWAGHCYEMTVEPYAGHTGTLEFTEGHRTIQTYIEGYEGEAPYVEFTSLPEGLFALGMNWLTDEQGSKRTVSVSMPSTAIDKEGVTYFYTESDTFHFTADNHISVNLTDPSTGNTIFTISLNEALGNVFDPSAVILVIKLKFTSSGVEVTVPDWKGNETDPGLG